MDTPASRYARCLHRQLLEISESDHDAQHALEHLQAWLQAAQEAGQHPAILSGNAVATLYAMGLVQRLGLQLGQDMGFIGIDETEWASLIGPGLSTIAQPTDLLGQMAVQCLLERIDGSTEAARHIQLPSQLIVRRPHSQHPRIARHKDRVAC